MGKWLVQRIFEENERFNTLMNDSELIHYIDMQDIVSEQYCIYDVSEFGKIKRVYYAGWQPDCLIEFVDEDDNIVLSGYGTDH